jgi:TRAP-type C4-dicarboxylate transport system substrate-binding protein
MRVGQLHAATITNIGLSRITRATVALQIPMTIQSYEELDYVRDKIGPKIEQEIEKQGFIVLNWGDAGWVHFFSKTPAQTPDDFRKLKLFLWNGDPESERAFKTARFNTVPLSSSDVMSSLSSGMVDCYTTTPLFAETSQWFTSTKNMVAVNWTPLSGATIVTKKQWEEIDPDLRGKLRAVAVEEGNALNAEVRQLDDKSVKAMVERGLKVVIPEKKVVDEWQKTAEMAYPEIRGKVVPAEYFDDVLQLVKEYRAAHPK